MSRAWVLDKVVLGRMVFEEDMMTSDYRGGRESTLWCAAHETPSICLAPMRFQLLAARSAFAALVLGALLAAIAVACVRLGRLSDPAGTALIAPATGLGVLALVL